MQPKLYLSNHVAFCKEVNDVAIGAGSLVLSLSDFVTGLLRLTDNIKVIYFLNCII